MKYTITIEETVCQDFDIEANSAREAQEIARKRHEAGKITLEPGELQDVKITVHEA